MAAGQGTRMNSEIPKVLHPVCGRPMVSWPIFAAREAGVGRIGVIVSPERDISPALPDGVEIYEQPVANGTGGAVRAAKELLAESETVLILSGDVPLVSAGMIADMLEAHSKKKAAATVVTAVLDDPTGYGRIVRDPDGMIERIAETKEAGDATRGELRIKEVNAGIYAFDAQKLLPLLDQLKDHNAQGEYYLPDVLGPMYYHGEKVQPFVSDDPNVVLGVNSRIDLARVEAEARRQINERHMLGGVTIVDPSSTWIDIDVELGRDVRLEPGCTLIGESSIGSGSAIGPHTTLVDSRVGEDCSVLQSYLVECAVADRCSVGPFAYLRPKARLEEGAKAGTFVEIKNSSIGAGAKVPHLSYIGDAEVGEGTNLGAATITANYDGFTKSRTKIGRNVRTGVDTTLIAPVEIGDDAYTGAGSVIGEDVEPGSLAVTRPDQVNVPGYAERKSRSQGSGTEKETGK